MRATILLTVLLLLAASVSAAGIDTARHIVIVGAEAPATDVVTAANFAASMKATTGDTYTSSLDSDAYAALTDDDVARKTIVIIDGQRAKLLGRNAAAQAYFEQQGFSVETVSDPSRDDLLLDTPAGMPPAAAENIDDVQDSAPDGIVPPTAVQQPVATPSQPEPELIVETAQPPAPQPETPPAVQQNASAAPEEPSVATRIWRWFASLF